MKSNSNYRLFLLDIVESSIICFVFLNHVKINFCQKKILARHLTGTEVTVVFGGGGARGCAHVGVIRRLLEEGIPIDKVPFLQT